MKILLATFWSIPHIGGVWNYMQQLKEKLEALGHEVDLLGYGGKNDYIHIVNENRKIEQGALLPLLQTKQNKRNASPFGKNPYINQYERLCDFYKMGVHYLGLKKYDIIHTQDVFSTTCIHRIRPKRTTLVATLHGCVAHEMRHHLTHVHHTPDSNLACTYFDQIEHAGATFGEYTIVANKWLKNVLTSEFSVPETQIKVHHYGYDAENFLKRMKEPSTIQRPIDKKVIIYTGRLAESKGVHHLISALNLLKKIRNDWICWIVGDGTKLEELQAQSKVLRLEENIIFFGKRDDIPALLSNSDIFVLPTLFENQPLSVIEAQLAGKPVIVSDVGGIPEIVEHGATGILFPAGNTEMLCTGIDELLEHESYRKKLGSNAQKWGLEHWSLDQAVQNVLHVYESAIFKNRLR